MSDQAVSGHTIMVLCAILRLAWVLLKHTITVLLSLYH